MNFPVWKKYLNLFRRSFRKLGFVAFVSAGQSLIFLLVAFLIRFSFDDVIPSGDRYSLIMVSVILLILITLNIAISLWTSKITRKITTQVISDLRDELLIKFVSFPRSYYSEVDTSKLHTNIVQFTQRLDVMNNSIVTGSLPSIVIMTGLIGVLIYMNWILFAIMVFTILPLYLVSGKSKKHIAKQVSLYNQSLEKLSKGMLFILQHMDLIQNQTAEKYEIERQKNHNDEMRKKSFFLVWADAIYRASVNGIVGFSGIIILIIGGVAVIGKTMTMGELLSFYVVISFMKGYLSTILYSIPLIIEGNEILTSLYGILQTTDSKPYKGKRKIPFNGNITFENVNFGFNEKKLLFNLNLSISPGNIIVLLGSNGVGKSTIVNLISGYYRPQSGMLYADGLSYDELDISYFRKHVGIVQQDPIIFSGSIWDNIVYGQTNASSNDVYQACRLATANNFIQAFPDGFETKTGEGGIRLSGGQRQKIAISRALLRKPSLLILDEPTNHLDELSQNKLIQNLKALENSPTILIISHAIEIIQLAQKTYYLNDEGQLNRVSDPIKFLHSHGILRKQWSDSNDETH